MFEKRLKYVGNDVDLCNSNKWLKNVGNDLNMWEMTDILWELA